MKKTIHCRFCALLLLAAVFFGALLCLSPLTVRAVSQYSSPLDDLGSVENFDVAQYPENATDYSLQVIALAESVEGELYVYVYQPSAATKLLTATSITIDLPLNDEQRNFRVYSLTLLGTQGVFQKYKVNSLTLRETPVRKYSVSEIFRAFDASIDQSPGNGNTISEKAYPVGKMWTLTDSGSTVSTEVVYEDVIEVTEKHIGYVKYKRGTVIDSFLGHSKQIYSHYIAFSTDRPIDSIFEVDVYFKTQDVDIYPSDTGITTETFRGEEVDNYVTLTSEQVLEINTSGFHSDYYKYKRIQSVDSFLEMEEQDITNQDGLEGKEWILRFYETSWSDTLATTNAPIPTYYGSAHWVKVTDVALLRIEYEYDGVIYNLGVVDDMQTGSKDADGSHGGVSVEDLLSLILGLVGLVLVFTVFWPFITPVISLLLSFIVFGFKTLFRFLMRLLLWFFSLPFKLLGWIFHRRR